MNFLYPLGLLALIAIPVLILIYIIKNRYTEQTVTSTYLWTLSEKFLKRRVPINRITGIINLILQILAVILIAVILAHPVLSIPNAADSYCFILDASGSMNFVQEDKTRFDIAKQRINEVIGNSMNGSTYTLIYVGNTTEVILDNYPNKERATETVNSLSVAYNASTLSDALGTAQRYFNDNPSTLTYLFTDKQYEQTKNVTIINVSTAGENYAVSDLSYTINDNVTESTLKVQGKAMSYESDASITLDLYFDDSETVYSTQVLEVKKLQQTDFEFTCEKVDFKSIKIVIEDADALPMDNEAVIYNVKHENVSRTVLVSDHPFFVKSALYAASNGGIREAKPEDKIEGTMDVISVAQYDENAGYGLYIFDNYVPEKMPRDGSVWFINPDKNIDGSNFSYQGVGWPRNKVSFASHTSTLIASLLEGTSGEEFSVYQYSKLSTNGKFTKLLLCDGSPLLFAGTNSYGNREVVFAFSFNATAQFTFGNDGLVVLSHLLDYSFPEVVEKTSYSCGEIIQINMISGCDSIRVETPSGKSEYPDTSTAVAEYTLDEVGVYTVYLLMNDSSERAVNIYSSLSEEERVPRVTVTEEEGTFIIQGTPENNKLNGIIDDLLIIFIILAVIAVADYGVYCYEQYQLR